MNDLNTKNTGITLLLSEWSAGNQVALEAVMPLVYDELRRIARRFLRRENVGHTLQATALVHEAFIHSTNSLWI